MSYLCTIRFDKLHPKVEVMVAMQVWMMYHSKQLIAVATDSIPVFDAPVV